MEIKTAKTESPVQKSRRLNGEIKDLIKSLLDGLMPEVEEWIRETAVKDPGKAAELILRMVEFQVPKLGRLDVKVDQLTDQELLAEIERRERMLRDAARPALTGEVQDAEIVEGECSPGPGSENE